MKKIPTLFERTFANHRVVGIKDEITPGCEEALLHGIATVKIDGSCCAIIDGEFYKRYDSKNGKKPPVGAIPCCDPDPVTGHWPHWVKVDPNNPADKWFVEAMKNAKVTAALRMEDLQDGTYEAVGPHFQGNPHQLALDALVRHGIFGATDLERTFDGIKVWLETHEYEGIVFWLDGEPVCKIKRTDFGLPWPVRCNHIRKELDDPEAYIGNIPNGACE